MSEHPFRFDITSRLERARTGTLITPHGVIETPAFIPVGTQATVKSLTPRDLENIGVSAILSNTYHLYLQPGPDTVTELGGLHRIMRWNKPLMTDSGGFQVFSLGWALEHDVGKLIALFADDSREELAVSVKREEKKRKGSIIPHRKLCVVDDEGATFLSHLDGSLHRWTPEKSMEMQRGLGADLVFALDECTSPKHDEAYTALSTERSHQWEERSLAHFYRLRMGERQAIYGIVQGGWFRALRERSARFVSEHGFFGNGIGGALVNKSIMRDVLGWVMPMLPEDRPSHLLGIGTLDDIFTGVEHGMDTFDCAHPTRIARHGTLLMLPEDGGSQDNHWSLSVVRSAFKNDSTSISTVCGCELCADRYTRGYLHHLFWARELLAFRLATIHNLAVMARFMEEIRWGIKSRKLMTVRERWMG